MVRSNEEKKVEISEIGKKFVKGTHVEFKFHRHSFAGIVEKQLQNSAMIAFDEEFSGTDTYQDAKGRIIISYADMKMLTK